MFRSKPESPPVEISMYTLSTCPWCRRAKAFFSERDVPFQYTDVDTLGRSERQAAMDKIVELCGTLQYPVVIINGDPIQGYNPDEYAFRLRTLGWDI